MRHFTLYFTTPKKFKLPSEIIKLRLGTNYSHVCIGVEIKKIGMTRIYQASHGDVNTVCLENFLKKNKVLKKCTIEMEEDDYFRMIKYMERQTGKSYSEWGAIAATFKFLRKIGLGKDGDNQFICSELVYRALQEGGMDLNTPNRTHADYIDPKVFEKALVDANIKILTTG